MTELTAQQIEDRAVARVRLEREHETALADAHDSHSDIMASEHLRQHAGYRFWEMKAAEDQGVQSQRSLSGRMHEALTRTQSFADDIRGDASTPAAFISQTLYPVFEVVDLPGILWDQYMDNKPK